MLYLSPGLLNWIYNVDEFPNGVTQILFHKIPLI